MQAGKRVAWSHEIATQHGPSSVLRAAALPPGTPIGTLVEAENEAGTVWVVEFAGDALQHPAVKRAAGTHPDPDRLSLTSDELVMVEEV